MNDQINPEPLNKTGKVMVALIILEVIVMWMFAIYACLTLPQEVPVHFGFKGEPTRYGDKSTFLIVPAAFSTAPVIFLLLTKFRFTLPCGLPPSSILHPTDLDTLPSGLQSPL